MYLLLSRKERFNNNQGEPVFIKNIMKKMVKPCIKTSQKDAILHTDTQTHTNTNTNTNCSKRIPIQRIPSHRRCLTCSYRDIKDQRVS